MNRFALLIGLVLVLCLFNRPAEAIVGLDLKFGGTYAIDGKRPGGIVQIDLGPLSPFAEYYKKSGVSTTNVGLNFIFFKLPMPIVQPYIGGGGGLSRSSSSGQSKSRALVTALAGSNFKLTEGLHLFGQAKYFYTFGSGAFVIRDLAIQAGVVFHLGL